MIALQVEIQDASTDALRALRSESARLASQPLQLRGPDRSHGAPVPSPPQAPWLRGRLHYGYERRRACALGSDSYAARADR